MKPYLKRIARAGISGLAMTMTVIALAQAPQVKDPKDQNKPAPPKSDKPGAKTLTITVPQAGEYSIRFLPSADAKEPAQLPIQFKDKSTTISYDASVLGKSPKIAVDDVKTGNSAIVPPAGRYSADKSTLELGKIDFDHIRQIRVTVTYDNKPVQVAQVTLSASDKSTKTKNIDTASQGSVTFDDVPTGKAKVALVYGDKLTESRDIELTGDHPAGTVPVTVQVQNKVATLEAPVAGTTPSTPAGTIPPGGIPPSTQPLQGGPSLQPAPPPHEGSGFAGIVGTLLGIAVAAGLIYLLYRWAQSGGMAATLRKAGIETAGPSIPSDAGTPWNPNAPAAPVVSDPTICQFCGQKKDAGGNCACTVSGAAINTGPTSAAIPTQPRLVATMGVYSGSVFPLTANGAEISVGREPTNAIALPNDTTVSRRHAAFRVENGGYLVSDEGSSNGVYVNGVKISGSQSLNPGDEVQIGNTRFRFEL